MAELTGTQGLWLWEVVKPILRNDPTLDVLVPGGWHFVADPRPPQVAEQSLYPKGAFNILSDNTLWEIGPYPFGGRIIFNTVATVRNTSVSQITPILDRVSELLNTTGHVLGNGLIANIFYETTDIPDMDRRQTETLYFYSVGARYTAEIEPT